MLTSTSACSSANDSSRWRRDQVVVDGKCLVHLHEQHRVVIRVVAELLQRIVLQHVAGPARLEGCAATRPPRSVASHASWEIQRLPGANVAHGPLVSLHVRRRADRCGGALLPGGASEARRLARISRLGAPGKSVAPSPGGWLSRGGGCRRPRPPPGA